MDDLTHLSRSGMLELEKLLQSPRCVRLRVTYCGEAWCSRKLRHANKVDRSKDARGESGGARPCYESLTSHPTL